MPTPKTKDQPAPKAGKKIQKKFAPINTTDRPVKINAAKQAGKRRFNTKRLVLSLGFILLITAAGTFAINTFTDRESGGASNQIKSVLSGEELKDYTSAENKFTILMPGIPVISETTRKANGKDIPITSYVRAIENGSKNYTFAVYDYSGLELDEPKVMEAALNNALQNTTGATLISSKAGKYKDLNALEGAYSVNDKGKTYESHIRYVIKDSRMYAMILIGSDQAKFDEFANSLRLN